MQVQVWATHKAPFSNLFQAAKSDRRELFHLGLGIAAGVVQPSRLLTESRLK